MEGRHAGRSASRQVDRSASRQVGRFYINCIRYVKQFLLKVEMTTVCPPQCFYSNFWLLLELYKSHDLCVGEITRKCGFVNQKIRGRRPNNFLIHEFTLSSGFSGLNHKKRPCENQCYIYGGLDL